MKTRDAHPRPVECLVRRETYQWAEILTENGRQQIEATLGAMVITMDAVNTTKTVIPAIEHMTIGGMAEISKIQSQTIGSRDSA